MVTLSFFNEIYLFSRQFTRFSSHISKKLRFIFKSFSAIYFCQKGGSLPPESRGIKMRVILFMCQLCHQEVELGKKEIRNITRRLEQYNLSKETVAELQEKRKILQSNVQILEKIRSQLTDAAKSELSRMTLCRIISNQLSSITPTASRGVHAVVRVMRVKSKGFSKKV